MSTFLAFFTFGADARPSALKIWKSRRTKVVPNECPQLFRLQLFLIFAYFDFAPPYNVHIYVLVAVLNLISSQFLVSSIEYALLKVKTETKTEICSILTDSRFFVEQSVWRPY
jgi:hypothetical protein